MHITWIFDKMAAYLSATPCIRCRVSIWSTSAGFLSQYLVQVLSQYLVQDLFASFFPIFVVCVLSQIVWMSANIVSEKLWGFLFWGFETLACNFRLLCWEARREWNTKADQIKTRKTEEWGQISSQGPEEWQNNTIKDFQFWQHVGFSGFLFEEEKKTLKVRVSEDKG